MIFVYGDAILDIGVETKEPIQYGSDARGSIRLTGGGSPANFSTWAAYLGADVSFCYKTGGGLAADYLKKSLKKWGTQGKRIVEPSDTTGKIVVFIDKTGERTMITDRGANLTFSPGDLPEKDIKKAQHLYLTGYNFFGPDNLVKTAKRALELARKKSLSISVDPSSYALLEKFGPERFLDLTAGSELFFPNRDEGEVLTGKESPEEIVKDLLNNYQVVALKLGSEGCLVGSKNGLTKVETREVVENPDTTGAGDSFDAGFVYSFLKNEKPIKAGEYANQVALECVKNRGARPTKE